MADKLIIAEAWQEAGYGLQWFIEEDGDVGGYLGDGPDYSEKDLAKTTDWELVTAHITAKNSDGVYQARYGFVWSNKKDAAAALRAIKAVWKDKSKKPWPEWAVKATAAGWRPPKGWAP